MTDATRLLARLAVLGALALPSAALACGGTFCSQGAPTVPPEPVEQNAERILFEVNPDGTISTTVEIAYTGDPANFAWVVPVPDTPTLEVVPEDVLTLLDDGTAPTLTGQRTRCGRNNPAGCTGDSGELVSAVALSPLAVTGCEAAGLSSIDDYDPVNVETVGRVGPYEPTVVESDDPAALIDWLNENGYFIAEPMEPYVAEYVASGRKFLAMRLAPDAAVSDITPVRMTYPGMQPEIPLVLTAVAAEPEMAIVAFVAGDSRYQSGNYTNMLMDPAWLRYDPSTLIDTNYYAVASWLADGVGGRAFFTEYAGPVAFQTIYGLPESEQWLAGLRQRHATLTRFFTRLSAPEMTMDPFFEPTDGGGLSATLDLSGNEPVDICEDEPLGACGTNYCGPGASCAETRSGAGCVCPEGTVAREIDALGAAATAGQRVVTCQSLNQRLFTSDDLAPEAPGPCQVGACGDMGTCVDVNGFATCECAEGYAAVPGLSGIPQCAEANDLWAPEEALVNGDRGLGFAMLEASPRRRGLEIMLGLVLLGLPILGARRRRR